jgi:hypothetical protein
MTKGGGERAGCSRAAKANHSCLAYGLRAELRGIMKEAAERRESFNAKPFFPPPLAYTYADLLMLLASATRRYQALLVHF